MKSKFKPLDIVRTPGKGIAIVQEVSAIEGGLNGFQVSIEFFRGCNPAKERDAWWEDKNGELILIDSLPRIISNMIAHPFGSSTKQGDKFFSLERGDTEPETLESGGQGEGK